MSFFENPEVDRYSEASEESVLAAKQFFSQRKGFLAREESPDKGVDLDVELLLDGQVSGFKFAVQLKSVQKLDKAKKGDTSYVRYSFKTSRLGYLCRRLPGVGIILLYDDEGKQLYFEHVKAIYDAIMDDVGDDSWKNNETVTIHIDEKNVLSDTSIKGIYETFKARCLNFTSMYAQKASDFDLPTFDSDQFKDPIEILQKYGYVFFNRQEYQTLYNIMSSLPNARIVENHKVLLLAAITYYEIGYYVEGDYYARKCHSFLDKYSEQEKELLSVAKLSSNFFFGEIDKDTYLRELKNLRAVAKSKMNSIMVGLKIAFLEAFAYLEKGEDCFEYLSEQISAIWKDALESDMEENTRQYCLLELLCSAHQLGVLAFIDTMMRLHIRRRLLGEPPLDDKISIAWALYFLVGQPFALLSTIWDTAVKTDDDYLKAMVMFKKNFMFYTFSLHSTFDGLHSGKSSEEIRSQFNDEVFNLAFNELSTAYNIFAERMNLLNAYKTLTLLIEINYLHSMLFQRSIDEDRLEKITAAAREMEARLQLPEHRVMAESMFRKAVLKEDDPSLLQAPLNKIQHFAKMIAESIGLPESRVENLVFDIRFLQDAKTAINERYLEVLQNLEHTKRKETLYEEKPKYVIRCKGCGYQTEESRDLQILLDDLRINHCHICF